MDPLTDIDLNWLRALGHLLETRSVSAAAKRAGVGQPAMSRTLAHLRRLFGDPLLVQTGHTSRLTDHAETVLPRVQDALAAVQLALRAPTRFDPHRGQFEVRIAANDYVHTALLAPWWRTVRKLAPGLALAMQPVSEDSIGPLSAGELDFAIGPALQRPKLGLDRFVVKPLWIDRYVCAMRAEHPCARGRFDLPRFTAFPHLRVQCGDFPSGAETALGRLAVQRQVSATVPSYLQALFLLRESDCLALLPERLVREARDLKARALPFEAHGIGLFLAFHPRSSGNPWHRWVTQNLLEFAAAQMKA
jgi:DNA-binding transcriptional LysR family regulator